MIYYDPLTKTYVSTLLETARLTHGFTTRESGDGRNIENILSHLRINQVIFKKIITAEQIHSANVEIYSSGVGGQYEVLSETDAIVTDEENMVLIVRTADCLPILYADPEHGIIGISHNGWRGTLKRISERVIEAMESKGASRENIVVVMGPGINSCCYDIPEERYFDFMAELGEEYGAFPMRGGKRRLNLVKLNHSLLVRAGLKQEHIDFFPFCTSCYRERFFSYRRDYHQHRDKFGEMFSYIVLN